MEAPILRKPTSSCITLHSTIKNDMEIYNISKINPEDRNHNIHSKNRICDKRNVHIHLLCPKCFD